MSAFTQEHAEEIAKKLNMEIKAGRQHEQAIFYHRGREIVRFGIRRASKQVPHDYIPRQLHMTRKECNELYGCTKTLEHFIENLRTKGLLPSE